MAKAKGLPEFLKEQGETLGAYGYSVKVSEGPHDIRPDLWPETVRVDCWWGDVHVLLTASKSAYANRWNLGYCVLQSGPAWQDLNSRKAIGRAVESASLYALARKEYRSR